MAQDNRKAKHTIWTTREDMVRRGMALSLPWFAFVNISFALMIFFRDALFHDTHARYLAEMRIVRTIDDAVIGIMLVCALLLITSRRQSWLTQGLLIILSLFWSWCSYYFISHWQLTIADADAALYRAKEAGRNRWAR
ncbi:membrane-associated sensor domain-containing protein [Citrobacter koseri]|uniref:membrane-associated sensor domain-containing protein n=1 Tax=Citrobacter koseri TaxID=545 RepID=UPI003CF0B3E4